MQRRDETSMTQAFHELQADYNAGKTGQFIARLRGVAAGGSGASYHIRNQMTWLHMIELFRHFGRNNYVVGQAVNRLCSNVLQEGIMPDPDTGDKEVDKDLKARWQAWTSNAELCDYEGEHDFQTLESLVLESAIVDGDVVVLPRTNGSLQMVEAHRLRTPSNTRKDVVNGIRTDPVTGRRREYWITKEDVNPMAAVKLVGDVEKMQARDEAGNRNVFHVYNPRRVSQLRGISLLAPVAEVVGMENDLQFAMLIKAQASACHTIIRELAEDPPPGHQGQTGAQETVTLDDGSTQLQEGLGPGTQITGRRGEKIKGYAPNIPNPEFFQHASLLLTFIAINLNMPVAVLLLDPSNTNFSGWRGAIDQARTAWRKMQRWLVSKFHRPVYLWQLRRWLAADPDLQATASKSGVNIFRHRWNPPSWPYIDPLKDAMADGVALDNLTDSPRRQQARRGRDWDEVAAEIVADNRLIIEMAIAASIDIAAANAKLSNPPDWRELLRPVPANPATAQIAAAFAAPQPQGANQNV